MDLGEAGLLVLWPVAVAITATIFRHSELRRYGFGAATGVVLSLVATFVWRPSAPSDGLKETLLPAVVAVSLPTVVTFLVTRLVNAMQSRAIVLVVALLAYGITFVLALSVAEKMRLIAP